MFDIFDKMKRQEEDTIIKVDKNEVIVRGYPTMLLTYFTQIASSLLDCEDISKEDLENCIKYATMSDKELKKMALKKIKSMLAKMDELNEESDNE